MLFTKKELTQKIDINDLLTKIITSPKIPEGVYLENLDFPDELLIEGMKVESEHTTDPQTQLEIALAHLNEDKDYYKKLKTIEKSNKLSISNLLKSISKRPDITSSEKKQAISEYGKVKYADNVNKKYPIDTEEHVRAAWNYINMPRNAEKYSSEEVKQIKENIKRAWRSKIDKNFGKEEKSMGIMDLLKGKVYPEGYISHRKDGDFQKKNGKWVEIKKDNNSQTDTKINNTPVKSNKPEMIVSGQLSNKEKTEIEKDIRLLQQKEEDSIKIYREIQKLDPKKQSGSYKMAMDRFNEIKKITSEINDKYGRYVLYPKTSKEKAMGKYYEKIKNETLNKGLNMNKSILDLFKGRKGTIGETRNWGGKLYKKVAEGKWEEVKGNIKSNKKPKQTRDNKKTEIDLETYKYNPNADKKEMVEFISKWNLARLKRVGDDIGSSKYFTIEELMKKDKRKIKKDYEELFDILLGRLNVDRDA